MRQLDGDSEVGDASVLEDALDEVRMLHHAMRLLLVQGIRPVGTRNGGGR